MFCNFLLFLCFARLVGWVWVSRKTVATTVCGYPLVGFWVQYRPRALRLKGFRGTFADKVLVWRGFAGFRAKPCLPQRSVHLAVLVAPIIAENGRD